MKTTVKNKLQIFSIAHVNEPIALFLSTEVTHFDASFIREVELMAGVLSRNACGLNTPVKKRAKNHGVRVRRGR